MAIINHIIVGASDKEVIENGIYREYGSTAESDVEGNYVTTEANLVIDTGIEQIETVITYTATEYDSEDVLTGETDTSAWRTVSVIGAAGNADTTFDLGDELISGRSVSGTKYDSIVDAARSGTAPGAESSAYFSQMALDPYEVKYSK
ncbi:MAG: hypothetical protein J7L15_06155 [Clostridiales bacterium]|nr:hypothetical protein [Clostridiales bacterium]